MQKQELKLTAVVCILIEDITEDDDVTGTEKESCGECYSPILIHSWVKKLVESDSVPLICTACFRKRVKSSLN